MRARYAKKLHTHDEVEIRVAPGQWVRGFILGDPRVVEPTEHCEDGVFFTVQTGHGCYQGNVRHTDLR